MPSRFNGRLAALLLFACCAAAPGLARNNIRDAFFDVYPGALGTVIETVPSQPNHCGVCHYEFTGGGARNPYGVALEAALQNFPSNPNGRRQAVESIENNDSDNDGFTTLTEVTDLLNYSNTPTFPGLTPGNVGNVTGVTLSEIQDHLVPSSGGDQTPPSVTVLAPNGGETLTANAPLTAQWTATDASGIAAINLYLSDDNGATYSPIALGLLNSGSHTWFAPNRPTAQAIFRVEAIDNFSNVGSDESDAVFAIQAPPGGIVPTTLRDFDMPGSQPFEGGTINDEFTCAGCHGGYDPAVEPWFTWRGSMMAQASLDPLFEACLAIANQDAPDSGDVCLRCHIPKGWLEGRSIPTDGRAMLDGDKGGVSCDICHRMVDPVYDPENPLEDEAILNALENPPSEFAIGQFVIDPTGTRRGPFTDAGAGHPILYSPFHREAAFCGTCHDVSNPAFEADGQGNYLPNAFDAPASDFSSHMLMPLERTYSEWLNSDYNSAQGVYAPQFGGNLDYVSTCQDCHMRDVTGQGCSFGSVPIRPDLPLHDMTGGSTWLPSVLDTLYPAQVDPAALQAGIARAEYMLQNAALLEAEQQTDDLYVTVTNDTGHKLPTGYPEGRRMWLNVRFYDANMVLLGESGAYDANTGVLTLDAEAKIYEAKLGVDDAVAPLLGVQPGTDTFHFALNNMVVKDNRIPPRGFTNVAYDQFGGAPVGASYADGQYWDVTDYDIPPGATSAEVTLYYQSTSKEYVEFLRDENTTNDAGQIMFDLWDQNGKCPPDPMATVTLPLTPPPGVGDLNCDGALNAADIDPFVLALTDPTGYAAAYPNCNSELADINNDGAVNAGDIDPFVALLVGG